MSAHSANPNPEFPITWRTSEERHLPVPPIVSMPVDDIVKLANAGVKVTIEANILPSPNPPPEDPKKLSGITWAMIENAIPILERFKRNNQMRSSYDADGTNALSGCAVITPTKVYFFATIVCTGALHAQEPKLFEDDAKLYPSDGLLAQVQLWYKHVTTGQV